MAAHGAHVATNASARRTARPVPVVVLGVFPPQTHSLGPPRSQPWDLPPTLLPPPTLRSSPSMEAPPAKSRAEKNRDSAETSRNNKREQIGEKAFLAEKAEKARELRKRQKVAREAAAAAAALAAQTDAAQPHTTIVSARLSAGLSTTWWTVHCPPDSPQMTNCPPLPATICLSAPGT